MEACVDGRPITQVIVRSLPPYPEGLITRWESIVEIIQSLHVTTRANVVRRYLVFSPGEPCSPLRLAESERILRSQPFLADAQITTYREGDGVRVEVETIDEISIVGGLSAEAESPYLTSLRLGDENFLGGGLELVGRWNEGFFYRDTWGGHLAHRQLFGRPYELTLGGARNTHGETWDAELRHAFLTDLQRLAWRVSGGETSGMHPFLREGDEAASVMVSRRYADVGGVVRLGAPGQLSLFGAALTREFETTADSAVIITETGLQPAAGVDVSGQFRTHRIARVNALWGVRAVRFLRVTGFDALTAAQDVRIGFQLSTMFGRSLSVLGSEDDDVFVAADLYVGAGTPRVFGALQVQGEGRQNYDMNRWDGILGSGRAAVYTRLDARHTFIASAEWSGGWRQRIPFQLTLADERGGVRGFGASRAAGARRAVLRLEERWRAGRPRGLADIGVAVFADAGRLWAGDVPFGTTIGPRVGVGAGLLLAVPPQSRRLWRLDVAFPIGPDPHAKWEIRLSSNDLTRLFWREPDDVRRNRSRSLPASVFSWP